MFSNCGWPIEHLGDVKILPSGEKVVAGWIDVDARHLDTIQSKAGFDLNEGDASNFNLPLLGMAI